MLLTIILLAIATLAETAVIIISFSKIKKMKKAQEAKEIADAEYLETMRVEMQREQDLENQLTLAKEASLAKSTFLSNMSHEIRTPINAIIGMNEIIMRESHEEDTLKYSQDIKASGEILLNIVNDILDLSKIEAGKTEIINERYELSNLLSKVVNMIDIQAENKGLKLDINIANDIPSILCGDESRLQQCILNLLTNAIKYTQEGSVGLLVEYRKINNDNIALTIKVSDTGVGISPDNMSKLFTPYERLDEAKLHTIEGTGLGLEIVNKLLGMMGSTLRVHSVYGEGSTFHFVIRQKVLDWEPIGDFQGRYLRGKNKGKNYSEPFHAPHARILVIDDTNMNLIVVKGLLKKTLIQIDTADSGREALSMVKQKKYDLIFIDHKMPGLDGIETHELMVNMEDNPNKNVPCIALTANAISGAREQYINAGFQDYLSKPVSSERLEKSLEKYLPADMIIYPGDPGFNDVEAPSANDDANVSKASPVQHEDDLSEFNGLEGINLKAALNNCDTIDILREALKEFYQTIPDKSGDIEKYAADLDYRNFTVAVHALKSNARLIGAMRLSDEAATLEQYGNAEDKDQISLLTPQLLRLYRSYLEKLAPMEEYIKQPEAAEEISKQAFLNALSDMKELLEVFDYDNAQSIMHMVECYRIPPEYGDKWTRIQTLMAEVKLDELLEELSHTEVV
ncbi:MAG: response regulator [Lachnospiraceae bacterium]|nr:response regulator [Lachnospiraceae bacterium]